LDDLPPPLLLALDMKNSDLVRLLLQSGARPYHDGIYISLIEHLVGTGNTALLVTFISAYPGEIDLNYDNLYMYGGDLLGMGIREKNLETFDLLLEYAVDITRKFIDLVHAAAKVGNYNMLKYILDLGADVKSIWQKPIRKSAG
jgi:ankyrin repeat protein